MSWTFPPDAVLEPASDFRRRLGHILVVAPDRESLDATLAEADRLLTAALKAALRTAGGCSAGPRS